MVSSTSSTHRITGSGSSRPDSAAPAALVLALVAGACGGDAPEPVFPIDYQATYVEVRDCRRSADHDLNYIRVLADPAALEPYQDRVDPFPAGAVVLKEEYADEDCTDLDGFTAMRKEAPGTAPDDGDWTWQKLTAAAEVIEEAELDRCLSCHAPCVGPPFGHDYTCADP